MFYLNTMCAPRKEGKNVGQSSMIYIDMKKEVTKGQLQDNVNVFHFIMTYCVL